MPSKLDKLAATLNLEFGKEYKAFIPPEVSNYSRAQIQAFLRGDFDFILPEDWDWTWVIAKGEYQGTLPKRISKFAKVKHQIKLPAKALEAIGNLIGQDKSVKGEEIVFDLDRTFAWMAGDYGDDGSCFWGSHFEDRLLLKDAGAFALRVQHPRKGRVWVMPFDLKQGLSDKTLSLASYKVAKEMPGLAVINAYGYGGGGGVKYARLLATHIGYTYKQGKVDTTPDIFINERDSRNAYLLHPPEIQLEAYNIEIPLGRRLTDSHRCCICLGDDHELYPTTGDDVVVCSQCASSRSLQNCAECGVYSQYGDEDFYSLPDGRELCSECINNYMRCDICGNYYHKTELIKHRNEYYMNYYCPACNENR